VRDSVQTLTVQGGHLCFDGIDLAELAGSRETPFFVYSERRLRANITDLRRAFGHRHERTEIFFASKACSNLWFLDVVRDAGINVEVNSGGELERALAVGFAPHQVIFNGVAKTEAEIAAAARAGVRALLADSMFELRRIAAVAAAQGVVVPVAPRIDVNVPTRTHPGLETAHGGKAGIDRDDAREAYRLAATDEHLRPVGLHLHVGSQITSVEPYEQAMDAALELVALAEAVTTGPLEFVNAGGGFAVQYREAPVECHPADYFCSPLTFADYATAIGARLARQRPDLTLFLEPGRSIAATTAVLVTRVENEKTKGLRDTQGRRIGDDRWVTIDAGFNTLLEHTNYRWYYRTIVANRAAERADTRVRLAGPLCDGGDVFAGDGDSDYRLLPANTGVGDVIVLLDTGAYALEMMNPYNARPRAAALAVADDGALLEVRRRETGDEMLAHDVRSPWREGLV
jgi:D-ornithine/D-lysine decarboxylase